MGLLLEFLGGRPHFVNQCFLKPVNPALSNAIAKS